jgi:hypothetical protein
MKMHGLVIVERDHEGDDKDSILKHKQSKINKLPHLFPKLWPPIILKH